MAYSGSYSMPKNHDLQSSSATADHGWHPGELSIKLLDLRPHDRDVSGELTVMVKQR
jgi:hypothetical protein